MSAVVDPKVVEILERRGFRRNPDPTDPRWMDECGHVLTAGQLAHETDETIDELIDWLHGIPKS